MNFVCAAQSASHSIIIKTMRLCPYCLTPTVAPHGRCTRCLCMFKYRGCPITAGANGLLNVGLINSFGHAALNQAYAAIDAHFDAPATTPDYLKAPEVRPEPMIAPTRIEVGTAPAYKSVTELAAEHPNLREFIADMEAQLD